MVWDKNAVLNLHSHISKLTWTQCVCCCCRNNRDCYVTPLLAYLWVKIFVFIFQLFHFHWDSILNIHRSWKEDARGIFRGVCREQPGEALLYNKRLMILQTLERCELNFSHLMQSIFRNSIWINNSKGVHVNDVHL